MSDAGQVIAIMGGCGHVGLPLGLTLADAGHRVVLYDVNRAAVDVVASGTMPFIEHGADELLKKHVGGRLTLTTDAAALAEADVVVCVVGTPIDEHLNPQLDKLLAAIEAIRPHLRGHQLFVLRSTVFPGATERIAAWLSERVPGIEVAFCPERIAQGFAVKEIGTIPQIVSGTTPRASERATALFRSICPKTIELQPIEAELAKLFCNAWRYISFAAANQFYAVCAHVGLDYYRIWSAIIEDYPRMKSLPKAGFAAGPCLFKDTMQLSAFFADELSLGQAAMRVNEGMPTLLVRQLKQQFDLKTMTVGILGMAFKGDNDDVRDSLAFKLKRLLKLECREVLCTDDWVKRDDLVSLSEVLERADLLVVGAPHTAYAHLRPRQPVLDPWNLLGRGGLLFSPSA